MGTLPESFLFFFFGLFASVTFRIARVPLHSSIASQSKRISGYTAYPENQNPIYLTYQGRRAARFQTDDELEVLQVRPLLRAWGGGGGDLMDRTWWRFKRGRFFFFFWVVWNVKAECVTFKAFMEDCYLCLVEGFVFSFWFVCFFFTRDVSKPQLFFIALF